MTDKDDIKSIVLETVTESHWGFNPDEVDELLKQFPDINMRKFNYALNGNTCMTIGGKMITYPCDLITALYCGMQNRDMISYEMD